MNGRNVSLDMCLPILSGNGHAVIAIAHKIRISNLEELDGRQAGIPTGEKLDLSPPLLIAVAQREEIAREIVVAADATDNRVQRHILENAPIPTHAAHLPAHILKREEVVRLPRHRANNPLQVGTQARSLKVVLS